MRFNWKTIIRRFLKLSLYLFLFWLALGLFWVILPFPQLTDRALSSVLNSGGKVTRVYEINQFFKPPGSPGNRRPPNFIWRTHMIMTFQLKADDSESKIRTLTFGGGENPLRKLILDWTWHDSGLLTNTNLTLPSKDLPAEGEPTISAPFEVYMGVVWYYRGNPGPFMMPWFPVTDTVLFNWWNFQETENIPLRIRAAPEDRTVQIWPDADFWNMYPSPLPPPPTDVPEGYQPLLSIHVPEDGIPQFIFPSHSSSPSTTYSVRLGLACFLMILTLLGVVVYYYGVFMLFTNIFLIVNAVAGSILTFWANVLSLAMCAIVTYLLILWLRDKPGWSAIVESACTFIVEHAKRGTISVGHAQGDLEAGEQGRGDESGSAGEERRNTGEEAPNAGGDGARHSGDGVLVDISEPTGEATTSVARS